MDCAPGAKSAICDCLTVLVVSWHWATVADWVVTSQRSSFRHCLTSRNSSCILAFYHAVKLSTIQRTMVSRPTIQKLEQPAITQLRSCVTLPIFVKIGQWLAKILTFFGFSRWRPPPSWIVEFTKFYWLTVSGRPRRNILPNFIKIDRSFVVILQFCEFSKWRPPPSGIFEIVKFYWLLW